MTAGVDANRSLLLYAVTPRPTTAAAATQRTCIGLSRVKCPRYSAKMVAMAPRAEARMTVSSDQPKRNAGSLPQPSRMKT